MSVSEHDISSTADNRINQSFNLSEYEQSRRITEQNTS